MDTWWQKIIVGVSTAVILILFGAIIAGADDVVPVYRWQVECSEIKAQPLEFIRGETMILEPQYLMHGVPIALSNATSVALQYRDSSLATSYYYAVTGSVYSATTGMARMTWSPAAEAAAAVYTYSIAVRSSTGSLLRAFGTIKLRDSVGGVRTTTPTTYAPTPWSDAVSILQTALVFAAGTTDAVARAAATNAQATAEAAAGTANWPGITNIPAVWPGTATDAVARAAGVAAAGTADWGGISNRPTVWPGTATDDVARVRTDDATNRLYAIEVRTSAWETAWINSTNWLASTAYGITSGMVDNWNAAYTAGTNWLASVAHSITAGDTNNWTTAYGWGNHASAGYCTPAQATNAAAAVMATGTVYNALNLDGVAAAAYVTNGGITINGIPLGNGSNITITAGGGNWWTNPPTTAITAVTNTKPAGVALLASGDGTNLYWQSTTSNSWVGFLAAGTNGVVTVATGITTGLVWGNEVFDSGTFYTPATGTFSPAQNGWYDVWASVECTGVSDAGTVFNLTLLVNGAESAAIDGRYLVSQNNTVAYETIYGRATFYLLAGSNYAVGAYNGSNANRTFRTGQARTQCGARAL